VAIASGKAGWWAHATREERRLKVFLGKLHADERIPTEEVTWTPSGESLPQKAWVSNFTHPELSGYYVPTWWCTVCDTQVTPDGQCPDHPDAETAPTLERVE
jgi:hypothetical protein